MNLSNLSYPCGGVEEAQGVGIIAILESVNWMNHTEAIQQVAYVHSILSAQWHSGKPGSAGIFACLQLAGKDACAHRRRSLLAGVRSLRRRDSPFRVRARGRSAKTNHSGLRQGIHPTSLCVFSYAFSEDRVTANSSRTNSIVNENAARNFLF